MKKWRRLLICSAIAKVRETGSSMNLNRITRRAALAGATALPFATARAQGKFPARPIKLIIPWAAGGPADAGFRSLAESVSQKLGQPVVVENKGGAAGVLGALALQDAKPDGYTICQMHMGMLRQPLLNPQLKYDPIKDLTYILQITGFVMGVVVRTDAPWKSLPELLAYAKANPGKMNYAGSGVGDVYAAELLKLVAGFKAESIRYKGNAPGITAIIAGEAHYTFASLGVVKGFVDSGRGRILATSGVKRSAVLPDLPTIAETIAPGFDYLYWTALFAPAGLQPSVFNSVLGAASQAIREPDVRKRLLELGYEAAGGGPEDVTKLLVADHAKWKRVKEETGIKAED